VTPELTEGQDHDSDRLAISQREDWLVITAYSNIVILYGEGTKMSYALITALIFTLVAIVHGWMGGADWPPLYFHQCLVGWPCRCCPASDLGLLAERLATASTAQPCGDRSFRTLSHQPFLWPTNGNWPKSINGIGARALTCGLLRRRPKTS
jgi:hypothetical protein